MEGHEREHENGANRCLLYGSAARTVLAEMEKITNTNAATVTIEFSEAFTVFAETDLAEAMETTTSTNASPVIWEWRDSSRWTAQALQPVPHNGKNGC